MRKAGIARQEGMMMAFDEKRFEAFAMLTEHYAKLNDPATGLNVDGIGEKLGLSTKDGREVAGFLADSGWAKLEEVGDHLTIKLTLLGYRQIAKRRRSRVIRWAEKYWAIAAIVVSAILSELTNFTIEILETLILAVRNKERWD
jgi:hypothetical protein